MNLLELTLETPAANLALDEALLEMAEASDEPSEVLRLWESPRHAVVLGRSSDAGTEVNLGACRQRGVPVLRRTSGGTTVVIGPGCLMYAVVLSYQRNPQLRMIEIAHQFVLERLCRAIRPQVPEVVASGTSDLTLDLRKFSGNSLRCRQRHLLYHGTIVYDFSTEIMSECLGTPARQPDYRNGRTHREFVANLPIDPQILRSAMVREWQASTPLPDAPLLETKRLVSEKYSKPNWCISSA